MKKLTLVLFIVQAHCMLAQHKKFDPHYKFLASNNIIADRNFYLLTIFTQTSAVNKLIASDKIFSKIYLTKTDAFIAHGTATCGMPEDLLIAFRFSTNDSVRTDHELAHLYGLHKGVFDDLAERHLRPSGYYQLFTSFDNRKLLLKARGAGCEWQ